MLKRFLAGLGVVVAFAGLAACGPDTPRPVQTYDANPPEEAVILDMFHWGSISGHIANPLRNCGNDTMNGDPKTLKPCLSTVYTVSYDPAKSPTLATKTATHNGKQPGGAYGVELSKSELKFDTGSDQIFLVVVQTNGGAWKVVRDYATNSGEGWNTQNRYVFVVTTWDPSDPKNETKNHPDLAVPFKWEEIMPQVLVKS